MAAEKYATGVKVSWRTEFEENIVGFKVWREVAGRRLSVTPGLVGGSIGKVRGGQLPAGDEYVAYDPSGDESSPYWLEAVDANSRSRWFGPVFATTMYSDPDNEAAKIEAFASRIDNVQTERPLFASVKDVLPPERAISIDSSRLADDGSALKMRIRDRGIYRISAQSLSALGFELTQTADWKVYNGGVEQPINVTADGSIEFYGKGIDTIQTDANVYWLTTDVTSGRRINRTNQNYLNSALDSSSRVVVERRERAMRLSSVINGARENWFGSYVANAPVTKTLDLRDIAVESNQTATLGIDLQGITNLVHQIDVKLNGNNVGQINFNAFDRKEWSVSVPLSALVEGTNTISLQSLNTSSDYSVTESLRITYPQRLVASGNKLEFTHDSNQAVKLRGFLSPVVRVFDVTDPAQVGEIVPESRLETDGTYTVTVSGTSTPKLLIASGETVQPLSAEPLVPNVPSDLRNTANRGRLIIISQSSFMKPLYGLQWQREVQGLPTFMVDIEDIYDEFGDGIKSAEALRSFLQFAKQNWAVKPDYVILAGDSSADPRNYSGMGGDGYNQVPTMFTDTWNIEAPTDEMLVDFDGDSIGEIAVGRLPAQNRDEMAEMVEKITNTYQMGSAEVNERGVHFVSDDNLGYNFAAASRNMASRIPASINVNYLDRNATNSSQLRTDLIGRINAGALIVNFFGHGSVTSWTSAGILRNSDAAGLFNLKRTPFIVSLACLNGDNTVFGVTGFAEAMMKRGQGGAFAVWAASGWNAAYEEELMGKDLYPRIFAGMPIGDAVREVKSLYPTVDMRRTFILFGDPSQRLFLPSN